MIEWNGKTYPDIRAAANANGVSYQTMYYRIVKRGYTSDKDLQNQPVETCWNGRVYKSTYAAARAACVSKRGMQYRRDKGYTNDKHLYDWSGIYDRSTSNS